MTGNKSNNLRRNPVLSVLLPNHNGAAYLKEALNSVLDQSFKDFELLVIDDASTDNSLQILESYKDPRLVILRLPENLGITGVLNYALEQARGEFIARMDADDVCLPKRFEEQLDFLALHPEITVVSSRAIEIDENGRPNGVIRPAFSGTSCWTAWELIWSNPIVHPCAMMRKSAVMDAGKYPASADSLHCEDYALWIELLLKKKDFAVIDRIHLCYRMHPGQITSHHFAEGLERTAEWSGRLINSIVGHLPEKRLVEIARLNPVTHAPSCDEIVQAFELIRSVGDRFIIDGWRHGISKNELDTWIKKRSMTMLDYYSGIDVREYFQLLKKLLPYAAGNISAFRIAKIIARRILPDSVYKSGVGLKNRLRRRFGEKSLRNLMR